VELKMAIPKISRANVLAALNRIDREGTPRSRKSTGYDLEHAGRRYSPKYVVCLAVEDATNHVFATQNFGGGAETNTVLRNLGFTIVPISNNAADVQGKVESNKLAPRLIGVPKTVQEHNLVLRGKQDIELRHYILQSPKHKQRWVAFAPSRIKEYRERGGEFCIVIVGDPASERDFYAIPYTAIAPLLVSDNLYKSQQRWQLHLQGDSDIFVFELDPADLRARPTFDASPFYGNLAVLGLDDAEIETISIAKGQPVDQGRARDSKLKVAIERHAMSWAIERYAGAIDTSKSEPYDLLWNDEGQEVRVEVKGTTSLGQAVFLTQNEVLNARGSGWRTDLVIVSRIKVEFVDGVWRASGGSGRQIFGWVPQDAELEPLQYRHLVPPGQEGSG
jgi:hypothetical protein